VQNKGSSGSIAPLQPQEITSKKVANWFAESAPSLEESPMLLSPTIHQGQTFGLPCRMIPM
jgi:hypothetical protein